VIRSAIVVAASVFFMSGSAVCQLFERAPDVLPGTTAEMHDTAFWIARMERPDEVILTLTEIQRRNRAYRERISAPDFFATVPENRRPLPYFYPGAVNYPPDLSTVSCAALADTVVKRIRNEIEYIRYREWGNTFGVKYSRAEIDGIIDEMALGSVIGEIVPRRGLLVRTSRLRNVPALYPRFVACSTSGSHNWDMWSMGVLTIGRPVTILYPSRSGGFLFVLSDIGYGWVASENVAFCSERGIKEFAEPTKFLVCTGDRVLFYDDRDCEISSGYFMMGDRLPAVGTDGRRVKVPVRKSDGTLGTATAWLRADADVHAGWLPYTRRNIVETAFKLLGNPYDWTGALLGRQHETTYRDIFACFGIVLPLTDPMFTFYGDDDTVLMPTLGRTEQYRVISSHEPFVTLQSCGRHGQIYLGTVNGEPIVFDQHGYGYEDENGVRLEVMRCNIGNMMMPQYFLERPVTFLHLK